MKIFELLKVKGTEEGFGYSKHLTHTEQTIRRSIHVETLIEEFEKHHKDWIIIPKHLLGELRYEKSDYVIVKTDLDVEGLEKKK